MEKRRNAGLEKASYIFFAALVIYSLSMGFENTSLRYDADRVLQYMRYMAYGLCMIKIIICRNYDKKGIMMFAVFFGVTLVQALVTGKREICFVMLFLLASKGVQLGQALRMQMLAQIFCFASVCCLCICGVFENLEFYDHGTIRYTMGFNYVSSACFLFFSIETIWLYLRGKGLKISDLICIILGWALIYYYTDTRTMPLLGVLMAFACYFTKFYHKSWKNNLTKFVCMISPICAAGFTWLLQLYYNSHSTTVIMKRLNQIFNGRLNLAKNAMEVYGFKWLGQKITWIGNIENLNRNKYNYVDCAYIKIPLDFGILISVLLVIMYVYIMYYFWEKESMTGIVISVIFLICGFMLPVLTNIDINPFLLMAGGIFHGKAKVHQT